MRKGFLSTLGGLLAGAGSVFGQSAPEVPPSSALMGPPSASAPVLEAVHPENTPNVSSAHLSPEIDELTPAAASEDDPGKGSDPVTGGTAGGTETGTGKTAAGEAKITGLQPADDSGAGACGFAPNWANAGYAEDIHFAVFMDYLTWFQKNAHALPALVIGGGSTTDADGNTIISTTGYGDLELAGGPQGSSLQYGLSSGFRLFGVYWWDQCPDYGVEANGLFLGKQSLDLRVDNCPVISRPFCNASDGSNGTLLVAFPGVASGAVTIHSDTRLGGGELNFLNRLVDDPIVGGYRFTSVLGVRYLDLAEGLQINSVTSYNTVPVLPQFNSFAGNQIRISDRFNTRNQFLGIQTGLDAVLYLDIGRLNFRTNLAFGANHEELNIQGNQLRVFPNGASVGSTGGLLALPSNMGHHTREQFNVVPEFNLNWFVPLTDSLELNLGYTFIYMDRTIRPGDQIDRTIDISQVPNFGFLGVRNSLNRPAVNFSQGDYYAHGFSVGMIFKW
jgi:hypothetical protein